MARSNAATSTTPGAPAEVSCSSCGARFSCGAALASCWCAALPALKGVDAARGCLCPACLERNLTREAALPVATPPHEP